ncbi:MAG: hypothetical protein ABI231_06730 [Candidatus Tumulicola sp.]
MAKSDSQVIGARIGANVTKNILLTFGFDSLPWRSDTVTLPHGVTCSSATNQIAAKGATLAYFLPLVNGGTAQCSNNADGTANVYYGGWASPYTDTTRPIRSSRPTDRRGWSNAARPALRNNWPPRTRRTTSG